MRAGLPGRRRAALVPAVLLSTAAAVAAATRAAPRMTVDLARDTGPFHGGASGSLYGLYGARLPFPNLIEGVALRTVSTKAQDGPQHPGADALETAGALADASGGDTYIYMTDIYRGFPYQWRTGDCARSVAGYLEKLRGQVSQAATLPSRLRDRIVFVPFNEPEGNMFGDGAQSCEGRGWQSDPHAFLDAWDRAYRTIRDVLPHARIAGPNTSILFEEDRGFLQHALAAGTLPDVFTWHELSDPATIRASVARYRRWEDELFAGTPRAGTHLPININEYAYNYHISVPGQMLQWIAAIEDMKVDADIAYWNIDGNLSDSAVQANRGNGQWWLLNAYAGMRGGRTVTVTPPAPGESYTLQGLAALDMGKRQARLLLGGATGPVTVTLAHIPAALGPTVRVQVREIGWSGQLGDSGPPRVVADLRAPVVGGSLDLAFGSSPLPLLRAESAYELILSPDTPGVAPVRPALLWQASFEAEDAHHSGAGYVKRGPEGSPQALDRFHTSGRYAVGGFATGKDVTLDFVADVPRDGPYDLSILGNSFNKDPLVVPNGATTVFLRIDGASERVMELPLGYKPVVWDQAGTRLSLSRGRHILTLSTTSADGRGHTRGNGLVDRVTLSLPDPDASGMRYEAQDAWLAGTRPAYGRSPKGGVPLVVGASATFWVYAAHDGLFDVAVDRATTGRVAMAVNGRPVRAGASPFLLGGINKVVLTGDGPIVNGLRVSPSKHGGTRWFEAEAATRTGDARILPASRARGGRAVTGIGGGPGNANTLTFDVPGRAGRYALTVRYSNDEQSPATHYNPDPLARTALVSVNGAAPIRVTFPNSFNADNWWELSLPIELRDGRNSVRFSAEEQPDFGGRTYASARLPAITLRSRFAPNIDGVAVTPLDGGPKPPIRSMATRTGPPTTITSQLENVFERER